MGQVFKILAGDGSQMTPTDWHDPHALDVREKLVHIDQMIMNHDRKRQEMHFAPWQVAFAGMSAGAGLLAAGTALGIYFAKTFGL
jgi:hypothetical protein